MSIRWKILFGCLCLASSTVLSGTLLHSLEARIGDLGVRLHDEALVATVALRAAQAEAIRLRGRIDRSLDDKVALPPDIVEQAKAVLADAEVRLAAVSGNGASPALRTLVDDARRRLAGLQLSDGAVTPRFARGELLAADFAIDAAARVSAGEAAALRGEIVAASRAAALEAQCAAAVALLLPAAAAWLLLRAILPPMRRATALARAIADGKLDTPMDVAGRDEAGDLLRALAAMQGALANRIGRLDRERAEQAGRLDTALESMAQGLCMCDGQGRIGMVNPRFQELFDCPDATVGMPFGQLARRAEIRAVLAAAQGSANFVHRTADDRVLAVSKRTTPEGGFTLVANDVTENLLAAERISRAASHDSVTGLMNRRGLGAGLQSLLNDPAQARRTALLTLDVDGFKIVNDAHGPEAGDALLRGIAERLAPLAGEGGMVARTGNDDFAVVRRLRAGSEAEIAAFGAMATTPFAEPFDLCGQPVRVGASVGVAAGSDLSDVAAPAAEDLIAKAGFALAAARAEGGNRVRRFEPAMELEAHQRRQIAVDLPAALARDEFEIVYQPFVDVPRHRVSGFEALVRWQHPTLGFVSPAQFIPIAEEGGMIVAIGLKVLEIACRHAADWPGDLTLAVNLSPRQLTSETLYADVSAVLERTGFDPGRLQLEVTEGVFLRDTEGVISTLGSLRRLGVRISMDDFGTGYSSLGYLNRFPFDKLKIDQSFVRGIDQRENLMIVRAVIGLSKAMGLSVIAEGVETRDQVEVLLAESCAEMQGYHFSRPLPLAELPRFLMRFAAGNPEPALALGERGAA